MGKSSLRAYDLALALLVLGCVFVAVAGLRYSLDNRAAALRETISGLPPAQTAVQASADWSAFTGALATSSPAIATREPLTSEQLNDSLSQIRRAIAAQVPAGPGDWAGLSTKPAGVAAGISPSATGGLVTGLTLSFRPALLANARVVAGQIPPAPGGPGRPLPVIVTTATAARLGLRPGSVLRLGNPPSPGLVVAAVIAPQGPSSTFWTAEPELSAPGISGEPLGPCEYFGEPRCAFLSMGVFAVPGTLSEMQLLYQDYGMQLHWEFPLALGGQTPDTIGTLTGDLNRLTAGSLTLHGSLALAGGGIGMSSGLLTALDPFAARDESVQQVLSLLAVSLTVIAAALLLLAARLGAVRGHGKFVMLRARGAALRQVAWLALRDSATACVPGAVAGGTLAILVTRGRTPPLAWTLSAVMTLVAVAVPPLAVAWQHRGQASQGSRTRSRRTPRASRRVAVEVTACAAAAGGLAVLHSQGTAPGSVNLYIAAAPALVAIPAVVLTARLYPLVITALLPLSARGRRVTGFLALSQAARTSLAGAAPAFALALTLTIASFAGMVQAAISGSQDAASWQATGADVLVTATGTSAPITAATQRAVAALPGVRHTARVWQLPWVLPDGQPVTALVVDPAGYAAYTAGTPFPDGPFGLLGESGGVLSVLASPAAAAGLPAGEVSLASDIGTFRVRVAGTVASTPALPAGGPFLIVSRERFQNQPGPSPANQLLITGSDISRAALASVLPPDVTVAYRASTLDALNGSRLQAGAYLLIRLSLAVAAGFGLIVILLGLALGAADRDQTLARLATMGISGGRLGGLVLLESLPAIAAAVVTAAACALALPGLISPALDLGAFTGPGVPVTFAPDLADVALPAASLVVLTAIGVGAELLAVRRRTLAAMLRVDL